MEAAAQLKEQEMVEGVGPVGFLIWMLVELWLIRVILKVVYMWIKWVDY